MKKENMTFRAFYFLAILFVVDGHIPLEGEILNFAGLFRYYSFHLMMFAFGSGYFFHSDSIIKGLLHDVRKILLPLYFWNLVYGLISAFLRKFFGASLGAEISLSSLFLLPVTDGQHFIYNLSAWFLSALFFTKCLYRLINLIPGKHKALVNMFLSLILGVIAVQKCHEGQSEFLPLFLVRSMILLPGYAFGVLYREKLEQHDTLPSFPYLLVIVLLRLLLSSRYENLAYLLSNCTYFPCDAFGVYAGALLSILFYLRISRCIAPFVERSRTMLFISRHTFDIMMHHGMGIWMTNFFFLLLNKFGLGASDFSVHSLRTVERYAYAPAGHAEWAVLYVITGIAFSCIVGYLCDCVRNRIKKKG